MNIRIDEIHFELLEKMVQKLEEEGVKTNKTDVIQKALFRMAREVLDNASIDETIDKYYTGLYKED